MTIVRIKKTAVDERHDAYGLFYVDGEVFGQASVREGGRVAVNVSVGPGSITLWVPEDCVTEVPE